MRAAAPLKVAWSQRITFCESLSGRRITDFDGAFGLTTERDERFPEPGALLPHCWLPDGSSLYDKLGGGFTLVTPAAAAAASVFDLSERARALRIPLTVTPAPADYPWQEFLLVRPDQHIAWRADDPAGIDIAAAVAAKPGG